MKYYERDLTIFKVNDNRDFDPMVSQIYRAAIQLDKAYSVASCNTSHRLCKIDDKQSINFLMSLFLMEPPILSLKPIYPCGVLGQVRYLIISIPEFCLLPYFYQFITLFSALPRKINS